MPFDGADFWGAGKQTFANAGTDECKVVFAESPTEVCRYPALHSDLTAWQPHMPVQCPDMTNSRLVPFDQTALGVQIRRR